MSFAKIEEFKKLLEIDSSEITFFGLGKAYLDEGQLEEAAKAFRKAIELKPNYTAVYLLLGEAFQSLNRLEEAIQVYEQGLRVAEQTRD
ncbi:MAG: tetratricopeptide repeat protein, partial [Nitrospira sp.]|nr:tetratricopeptide repeat protein [Nitrospira sp.]